MTTAVPTRRRRGGAIDAAARPAAGDAGRPSTRTPPAAGLEQPGGIVAAGVSGSESVRYPGGKGQAGHWQWLVSRMPTHARYIELFAGRAALFRRKPPALSSVLIDRDPDVVAWHRARNWPATEVIEGSGIHYLFGLETSLDEDDLIYADPPFVLSTRTKQRIYKFEMSDREHELLLAELNDTRARVMISGYPSPLYNDLLSDWWCDSREVMTRGGLRLECLWMNFNPARVKRDVGIRPGSNWRERQRIARKVARHERLFAAMPDYEQDAILAALLEYRRRRSRRG